MVVIILGRELLVTSLRGIAESGGAAFGAVMSGKIKMVLQSATILVILVYVNYMVPRAPSDLERYSRYFRDFCIWMTILTTLSSGLLYVRRAMSLYRASLRAEAAPQGQLRELIDGTVGF